MRVVVDTSVWSLALRRRKKLDTPETEALTDLIKDGRVVLLGAIRQEILSGIRDGKHFKRLEAVLEAFEDEPVTSADYVHAARLCNACLNEGVIAGNTDCLICAVAISRKMQILTTDKDFSFIAKVVSVDLHETR